MKYGQSDPEGRLKEVLRIAQQIERLTQDLNPQKETEHGDE